MATIQSSLRRSRWEVLTKCMEWAYRGEQPFGIAHNVACFSGDAIYGTDPSHSPTSFSAPSSVSGLVPLVGLTVTGIPWTGAMNYIATENGANNAIAGTLGAALGAAGGPAQAAGLIVTVLLAHTLQAGANTFAYAGNTAAAIKSHFNPANNIGTAYAVGGLVRLCFDGTNWQDLSQ